MNEIMNVWSMWENDHDTTDQMKRLESGKQAACTPISVDKDGNFAYFESRRGKYETFLDRCSCTDFSRRNLPCKHMYRLAMELSLIDESYKSYIHGGYTWKESINIIESYPEEAQKEFYEHFTSSCRSSDPYRRKKNPQMDLLISSGVLIEYPEKETAKFKTVRLIEDFMVDKQKVKWYFSRKFYPPTYYDGNMVEHPDKLPEDEVTEFLRERGFY